MTPGLLRPGNIDLARRPEVHNSDGTTSTVRSMSFNENGREILVPTVAQDGSRILSDDEAIDQYHKTGQHLGMFDTPEHATAYGQQLHEDYASGKIHNRPPIPGMERLGGVAPLPPKPPLPRGLQPPIRRFYGE